MSNVVIGSGRNRGGTYNADTGKFSSPSAPSPAPSVGGSSNSGGQYYLVEVPLVEAGSKEEQAFQNLQGATGSETAKNVIESGRQLYVQEKPAPGRTYSSSGGGAYGSNIMPLSYQQTLQVAEQLNKQMLGDKIIGVPVPQTEAERSGKLKAIDLRAGVELAEATGSKQLGLYGATSGDLGLPFALNREEDVNGDIMYRGKHYTTIKKGSKTFVVESGREIKESEKDAISRQFKNASDSYLKDLGVIDVIDEGKRTSKGSYAVPLELYDVNYYGAELNKNLPAPQEELGSITQEGSSLDYGFSSIDGGVGYSTSLDLSKIKMGSTEDIMASSMILLPSDNLKGSSLPKDARQLKDAELFSALAPLRGKAEKPAGTLSKSDFSPSWWEQTQYDFLNEGGEKGFKDIAFGSALILGGYGYGRVKGAVEGFVSLFNPKFYTEEIPEFASFIGRTGEQLLRGEETALSNLGSELYQNPIKGAQVVGEFQSFPKGQAAAIKSVQKTFTFEKFSIPLVENEIIRTLGFEGELKNPTLKGYTFGVNVGSYGKPLLSFIGSEGRSFSELIVGSKVDKRISLNYFAKDVSAPVKASTTDLFLNIFGNEKIAEGVRGQITATRILQAEKGLNVDDPFFNLETLSNKKASSNVIVEETAGAGGVFFGSTTTQMLPEGFITKMGDIDIVIPGGSSADAKLLASRINERLLGLGERVQISREKPSVIEFTGKKSNEFGLNEKVIEIKTGSDADLDLGFGVDDIAPAGGLGFTFADLKKAQSPKVVKFGKGRAITAGEQFTRKSVASAFFRGIDEGLNTPEGLQQGGVLPRGRRSKDIADLFIQGKGLIELRRGKAFDFQIFKNRRTQIAEEGLNKRFLSLNPAEQVEVLSLIEERLAKPEKSKFIIDASTLLDDKALKSIGSDFSIAALSSDLTFKSRGARSYSKKDLQDAILRDFMEGSPSPRMKKGSPSPRGSPRFESPSLIDISPLEGSPSPRMKKGSPSPRGSPSPGSPGPSKLPSPSYLDSPYPKLPSPSPIGSPSPSPRPGKSPSPIGSPIPKSPGIPRISILKDIMRKEKKGKRQIRKVFKERKQDIYLADFSSKVLDIGTGKVSDKVLRKLLKGTYSGFEFRKVVPL